MHMVTKFVNIEKEDIQGDSDIISNVNRLNFSFEDMHCFPPATSADSESEHHCLYIAFGHCVTSNQTRHITCIFYNSFFVTCDSISWFIYILFYAKQHMWLCLVVWPKNP